MRDLVCDCPTDRLAIDPICRPCLERIRSHESREARNTRIAREIPGVIAANKRRKG